MAKVAGKSLKKGNKQHVKSMALRRLQRSRPKRYMNPFLCFIHEEIVKAKKGTLLPAWKSAHKGLGGKWRALGSARANFKRHGNTPAFAMFVKASKKRQEILPDWIRAHKGLGAKWKHLDNTSKAKYIAASRKMKGVYEQRMNLYRQTKKELIENERETKSKARLARKMKRMEIIRMAKLKNKKIPKRNKLSTKNKKQGQLNDRKIERIRGKAASVTCKRCEIHCPNVGSKKAKSGNNKD